MMPSVAYSAAAGLAVVLCGCFVVSDPPSGPNVSPEFPVNDAEDAAEDRDAAEIDMADVQDEPDLSVETAICAMSERRCDGRVHQACGDDRISWVGDEACAPDAECQVGECVPWPLGYKRFCSDPLVPCPADQICQQGLCLTRHLADDRGAACLTDSECLKPWFCNGLGECSVGSESDTCRADTDCRAGTPVCDPFGRRCSTGGLGSPCVPGLGCIDRLICGPEYVCQTGLEGSLCGDPSHCALLAPICGPGGECQDGEQGDDCDDRDDCAGINVCDETDICRTPREGEFCENDGGCGDSAPHCVNDACYNGSREDSCDDDTNCFQGLVCGPTGHCQGGVHGDLCEDALDCGAAAPVCFAGACQAGGLNDGCEVDQHCGPGTPICGPTDLCQQGYTDDLCDGPEHCIETLVCRTPAQRCGGALGDPCGADDPCGPDAPHCNGYGRCDTGEEGALCRDGDDCAGDLYCASDRCFDGSDDDLCLETVHCFGGGGLDCVGADCSRGQCAVTLDSGVCVVDDACVDDAEQPDENPCLVCDADGNPFGWTEVDDDTSCGTGLRVDSALCTSGVCVITCEEGWGDCDQDLANGCERRVEGDVRHCGGCNVRCQSGEVCTASGCQVDCGDLTECGGVCRDTASDPAYCGGCETLCQDSLDHGLAFVCEASTCNSEAPCPANHWNADGDPANGCEHFCEGSADDEELCNGIDDNCDGEVDEGFDLSLGRFDAERLISVDCGVCGRECTRGEGVVTTTCTGGRCHDRACAEGFDLAADPAIGCVATPGALREWWVDAGDLGGVNDGGETTPFLAINDALAVAEAGHTIHVAEGTYYERLHFDTGGVRLEGVRHYAGAVQIIPPGSSDEGILVTAADVQIHSLAVKDATVGIRVLGAGASIAVALHDLEILDTVAAQAPDGEPHRTAYGILLDNASGSQLTNISVQGVRGAEGDFGTIEGSDAVGIAILNSDDVSFSFLEIENVRAGDSPQPTVSRPKDGADATGLLLRNSRGASVVFGLVSTVAGGVGASNSTRGAGGGGRAVGIHLDNADACEIEAFVLAIQGGAGGSSSQEALPPGAGGVAAGLWFEGGTTGCSPTALLAAIAGGDRGVHVNAEDDALPEAAQTSYGLWIDRDSADNRWPQPTSRTSSTGRRILMAENTDFPQLAGAITPVIVLSGASDEVVSGYDLTARLNPTNWGKIAVFDSSNVTIRDVSLAGQRGLVGCEHDPCPGGDTVGITLDNCADCAVEDVRIDDLWAGSGGFAGSSDSRDGGDGGDTAAIALRGDTTATVANVLVHSLEGGPGGFTTHDSGSPGNPGTSACLLLDDTATVDVRNLTCDGGASGHPAAGASIESADSTLVIRDSILSQLDAGCVLNPGAGAISVEYTVLHACAIDSPSDTTTTDDPLFVGSGRDYHVECNDDGCSSAIDLGALDAACGDEPPPNGGRVNAGYYGNTAGATSDGASDDVYPCP